jgi:adenine-specific DNA-methyltransferase
MSLIRKRSLVAEKIHTLFYLLIYARNKTSWRPELLPRTAEMEARYKNIDGDSRGPWKAADLSARNRYDAGVYAITCPSGKIIDGPPKGMYWRFSEAKFRELDANNRIWWGADGNNVPAIKRFLSEVSAGRTPQTLWFYKEVGHTQDAKKTLLKYVKFQHTENVLNSVKPVELLQRILQLAGKHDENGIVLDFFSGSATTAHAVLKQNFEDGGNRRFIGVQIPEPLPTPEPGLGSIFEMGLTRVRNYADELREQGELTKGDLGLPRPQDRHLQHERGVLHPRMLSPRKRSPAWSTTSAPTVVPKTCCSRCC